MPLTELQKRAAQAIVNIFETGSARGEYDTVTLLPGDSGHLTYGRSQTTLGSGNLYLLIKAYCASPGAAFAQQLRGYLPRLEDIDLSLDHDHAFRALLKDAGCDPVMQEAQDAFFDRVYWTPAALAAEDLGLGDPLSVAVVYDSKVHGSWPMIRDRVSSDRGRPGGHPRDWTRAYVDERRRWLAGHSNSLLRRTVYRMDAFHALMRDGNWSLALPFSVRGTAVTEDVLDVPPIRVSAEDLGQRALRLTDPPMTGRDVEAVQRALADLGWAINIDGKYDDGTARCVRQFQQEEGLEADGIAGPATFAALGLG